jgi:RNA polymerase sigma-54 factor
MAMIPKLELRQSQGLVMTPQLQQAIKLLQMSNFELQSFVEAELERNPLLERDEATEQPPASGVEGGKNNEIESAEPGQYNQTDGGVAEGETADSKRERPVEGQSDSGWSNLGQGGGGSFNASDGFDLDNALTRETTLYEHLTEQLNLNIEDPGDRLIGGFLIGMVDEAGYLAGDLDGAAQSLGAPVNDVERVLAMLQDFDPPGACARNLQECLELQLKEAGRLDPAMAKFIGNLALLAKRDYSLLEKICGVGADDIKDMVKEVKGLNPKPGNAFGRLIVQSIVPDVIVKPAPDGSWLVELNSETLPKVLVNQQYFARVSRGGRGEEDKVYLSQCLSNAQWLVKSLDQRARTILKVAREIVRQQDGFLMEGVKKLRPLNLKTVAEAIAMHESTVSRVTSNKFMATPRGTFELKYFFTTAIGATGEGEDQHSAETVRHRIREMIDGEAAGCVLSDDAIVEQLKTEGIEIARRTVAKYREAMGIQSSVQRRREKRIQS